MVIMLWRHGGDTSRSLAGGTPQGLRYSWCTGHHGPSHVGHNPRARLGSPMLHVVLPTAAGQDVGARALGGARAKASSPL